MWLQDVIGERVAGCAVLVGLDAVRDRYRQVEDGIVICIVQAEVLVD